MYIFFNVLPEFIINISQKVSPIQARNVHQVISKVMRNEDITRPKKMVRAYVTGKSVLNIILKGIPQS